MISIPKVKQVLGCSLMVATCIFSTSATAQTAIPSDEFVDQRSFTQPALDAAFTVCMSKPVKLVAVTAALEAEGWVADKEAVGAAMMSAGFATNLDTTDIVYSLENAGFMVISLLGNSGLGPDQLGFVHEDKRLAVVGVVEGTPWCALTGPENIYRALRENGFREGPTLQNEAARSVIALSGETIAVFSLLNIEHVRSLIEEVEDDPFAESTEEENELFFSEVLSPANIIISPKSSHEER